ncbi:hypothetical protein ETU10_05665 [Apibacter muscae]|uniref:hypothetical protein n=1 Tax=Apibacter muscae TaxID=2509004 RepID=UPI0011AC4A05|nr:hypothetical protein [Apibacter muscae]TWP23718.1 hypothetical protein ETU10_05665 [Apibacter muscae]
MSITVALILGMLGMIVLILVPIFLVAILTSQSRKRKRKNIINKLPSNVEFYAPMRINSERKNNAFFKFTSFECSGILYAHEGKLFFRGTKKQFELLEFNLDKVSIYWIGVQAQNGALQWFSIKGSDKGNFYFNLDTGMTIFNFSKSGETTKGIYEKIMNMKLKENIDDIGKV